MKLVFKTRLGLSEPRVLPPWCKIREKERGKAKHSDGPTKFKISIFQDCDFNWIMSVT